MIFQLSPYTAMLFVTAVVLAVLARYVWQRRSVPGGTYFALFLAAVSGWVFMTAVGNSMGDGELKILFVKIYIISGLFIPPLWILFAMEYCGMGRLITKERGLLLWILPAITVIITLTNEYHGLMWTSIKMANYGFGDIIVYDKGIVSWAMNFYSYALVIPGYLLLLRKSIRDRDKNSTDSASLLLGAIITIVAYAVSPDGFLPLFGVDLTPFAFTAMGAIFSWGVFRHGIFELMPIATEELIESMAEGAMVLNPHGAVVKINTAARKMLGITGTAVGQPAKDALARWPSLTERLRGESKTSEEIVLGCPDSVGLRWIDASISRLNDEHDRSVGTLLILRDITERKRNEESLRNSEHDRAKAEHMAHIGYFEWDLQKRTSHVSEGCALILGFPASTDIIAYEAFTEKIHPEDVERIKKEIRYHLEQGTAYSLECRMVLPDGSIRHVYSEFEDVIRDSAGVPIRQFGIVQDITERKQNEEALRNSERDRERAEHMAHLGYYEWDLKTKMAQVSEGAVQIFGFTPETATITYDMFTEKLHPEDAERVKLSIRSSVQQGEAHSEEYRIILPDGSIRHVRSESETAVKDPAGALVKQFGIVQDITGSRLAEEALRLSEERYKLIVETANESICVFDAEAKLVFVNSRGAEMLGYTPNDMLGRSIYEFVDIEYHDLLNRNVLLGKRGINEQHDYKLRRRDGGFIWVIATSSSLINSSGKRIGSIAMLTDITDRKLADEQLKVSLKEKEALIKEVHHRVKNNLQIITSLLNLQSNGIEDARYIDLLRDSQNRIKSMALVHELLYKSKDLSNISIAEYLEGLTKNLERSYSHSGNLFLRVEIDNIFMDVDRAVPVGIIVTELVSNAFKYAFPGGRPGEIWVRLHRDEVTSSIVLSVSDDGAGLPADFEARKNGSLGVQLVELLARQIDGTLEINRADHTMFIIRFRP